MLEDDKKKTIRDSVHGYIEIANNIFADFIDTEQFQRLRNIRQTSLDVLYPSAKHSRFEHSLGVYYLGKCIFRSIVSKQQSSDKEILENFQSTVELACLLHDIGHAPFSHLGEAFYSDDKIIEQLKRNGIEINFIKRPARHELMSCLVSIEVYKNKLEKYNVDKDFFCRMITGIDYQIEEAPAYKLKNALINILSGSFDADKIDYIMRDAQSTGISYQMLDVARTIKCFNIINENGSYIYVIEKQGFSVIGNIVGNRNYLYLWAYFHHKVQYHHEVIRRFLKSIKAKYSDDFNKLFSFEAVVGTVDTSIPFVDTVAFVDDNDIIRMMKYLSSTDDLFKRYHKPIFERNHFTPIWKTKIEFDKHLEHYTGLQSNKIQIFGLTNDDPEHGIERKILEKANNEFNSEDFIVFSSSAKVSYPESSREAKVYLPDHKIKLHEFKDIFPHIDLLPKMNGPETLYIFVNREKKEIGDKILNILNTL